MKHELNESTTVHKGWVRPKTREFITWKAFTRPYHTQAVAKNPEKFGTTKEKLLKVLEKQEVMPSSGMDSPEKIEKLYSQLSMGIKDIDYNLETYMIRTGWAKITLDVGDGQAEIVTTSAAEGRKVLQMIEDNLPRVNLSKMETRIWVGKDTTNTTPQVSLFDKYAYETFLSTGRVTSGRTEIGNTMARFREWIELQKIQTPTKEKPNEPRQHQNDSRL